MDSRGLSRDAFTASLPVTRDNFAELANCAYTRRKIENEPFNVLKRHGRHLEHNFRDAMGTLANVLAFAPHATSDLAEALWRKVGERLGTRPRLFEHLRILTECQGFPDWDALMACWPTAAASLSCLGPPFPNPLPSTNKHRKTASDQTISQNENCCSESWC